MTDTPLNDAERSVDKLNVQQTGPSGDDTRKSSEESVLQAIRNDVTELKNLYNQYSGKKIVKVVNQRDVVDEELPDKIYRECKTCKNDFKLNKGSKYVNCPDCRKKAYDKKSAKVMKEKGHKPDLDGSGLRSDEKPTKHVKVKNVNSVLNEPNLKAPSKRVNITDNYIEEKERTKPVEKDKDIIKEEEDPMMAFFKSIQNHIMSQS